jgi:hypothetical protein
VCGLHDALVTADFATDTFAWIKLGSTAEILLRMKEFALEAICAAATVRTVLHVVLVGEWLKSQEVVKVRSALAFLKQVSQKSEIKILILKSEIENFFHYQLATIIKYL